MTLYAGIIVWMLGAEPVSVQAFDAYRSYDSCRAALIVNLNLPENDEKISLWMKRGEVPVLMCTAIPGTSGPVDSI